MFLEPPCSTFLQLLSQCQNTAHLKLLNSRLIINGLLSNNLVVKEFIKTCFDLGSPQLASQTFNNLRKPNLTIQNLVLRSLCNHGSYENVLSAYSKCRLSDNYTFPFVIKACSYLGAYCTGKEVHCAVLRNGYAENVVVQTALVDFYGRIGCMALARRVLDGISDPDLVSWNALIAGYSWNGADDKVFEVLKEVCLKGFRPNVSTLATVLPVSTRCGCSRLGKSLHGVCVKFGICFDEYLVPALVSIYAADGDLVVARDLFDSIEDKNVTMWNSMISADVQNQENFEAFSTFQEMLHVDIKPSLVTFVSVIPSCEGFGCLWCGEAVHSLAIKYGFEEKVSVATALVSMYANFGNLTSAVSLFDHMPEKNLLSWNSMISGFVHNRCLNESFAMFRKMQLVGIVPDAISVLSVLSACSKVGANFLGKSTHAFCLKTRFGKTLNVSNALLAFYSDCCNLSYASKIFSMMDLRNEVSWNTLIAGYVHIRETAKAVHLIRQMQQTAIGVDSVTFITILPSLHKTEYLPGGMVLHSYAMKLGFATNVILVNALITMYCNCGYISGGRLLLETLPERDVISWNALLTGYRNHNFQNEAMELFQQMIRKGMKPNYVTLVNALPICCTELQGRSLHAYALRSGISGQPPLLTSLISMYARFGRISLCSLLFEMGDKNISLWNSIMSVHVQSGNAKRVVSLFSYLLQMGTKPDHVTILNLISACSQLISLNLTLSLMAYVIKHGTDEDVTVNNALIDSYARCGQISAARKLFDGLKGADPVSWSTMINGYAMHGNGEAALAVLMQMKLSDSDPDSITYLSVLSACGHAGLVEEGQTVFNGMVEDGIQPKMEHYACMVDLLGRTGHLSEAYDLVERLPHNPSSSLLESLLGACLLHGNVELGEKIGSLLSKMDPDNPGIHVMLYNLYISAERRTDAKQVRAIMEKSRLTKTPGFSLIEENKDAK